MYIKERATVQRKNSKLCPLIISPYDSINTTQLENSSFVASLKQAIFFNSAKNFELMNFQ